MVQGALSLQMAETLWETQRQQTPNSKLIHQDDLKD